LRFGRENRSAYWPPWFWAKGLRKAFKKGSAAEEAERRRRQAKSSEQEKKA
jgi:hypothetical protein